MKIKALKTGPWADPCASLPPLNIEEGKEYTVNDLMGKSLIDCEAAEEISDAPEQEKTIDEMTKGELVDYAEEYGIEIDASSNKPIILAAIKKAVEEEE